MNSDLGLPLDVWTCIFSYLTYADLRRLMLVGRAIKAIALPFVYKEVFFTEKANAGLRLAIAIRQGKISAESIAFIRKVSIVFSNYCEILATLELLYLIQGQLKSLNCLSVIGNRTEDCIRVVSLLATDDSSAAYELEALVCAPVSALLTLPDPFISSRITRLQVPIILSSSLIRLTGLEDLSVMRVIHDLPVEFTRVPRRMSMCFADWYALGCPPCFELELHLLGERSLYHIDNPALEELRIVGPKELFDIKVSLHTPSLRILILCDLSALTTVDLLRHCRFYDLEFLSVAPITVPVLQCVATVAALPSLRLFMALLLTSSFKTNMQREQEARSLVEWLQMVASKYAVDLLDFTRRVKRNIYFSEGLWAQAAHGPYNRYLSKVVPPRID